MDSLNGMALKRRAMPSTRAYRLTPVLPPAAGFEGGEAMGLASTGHPVRPPAGAIAARSQKD
jgi:hypothetical protein